MPTSMFAHAVAAAAILASSVAMLPARDYTLPASAYQPRLKASDPATWHPVALAAKVPEGGLVLPDGGLFKTVLERNTNYLLNSFSVNHMMYPFWVRAGKPVVPDARPQVGFWDKELRGSNAGRFLMGAGNTLRWLENVELRRRMTELVDGIESCRETVTAVNPPDAHYCDTHGDVQFDGYILAYPPDPKKVLSEEPNYGRAWFTHGLIDAAIAGNPKAYGLLRGHADWFNQWDVMHPRLLYWSFNSHQGHIASTRTYLSPIGKAEDLQVAEKFYVCDWWLEDLAARKPEAVWLYPLQNPHSYLITSFEAYLDHYIATGDKRYLEASQGAWELIHDLWEHVGGSIAICENKWVRRGGKRDFHKGIFKPSPGSYGLTQEAHTGETCGTTFWVKFNQRFHLLYPNEEKYVNEIEKSLYNVALAAQLPDGVIRYHAKMQDEKDGGQMINTCCEGQGTRLLGSLPEYIYTLLPEGGLSVNLYEASTFQWKAKGETVSITQKTNFPFEAQVSLKIAVKNPVQTMLNIRVPAWAQREMDIVVNGQKVASGAPGSFVPLRRIWADGDTVEFTLPAGLRATRYTGADKVAGGERYAVEYGPILLACVGPEKSKSPHKIVAKDLLKSLRPIEGKPMHYTIEGDTAHTFVPYWQIVDKQRFTVFPVVGEEEITNYELRITN